jgi:hypothetical protein
VQSHPHPPFLQPLRQENRQEILHTRQIQDYNNPDSPLNAKYAKLLETCNDPESGRKLDPKYGVDIYRRECEKCSGEESYVYVDKETPCGACALWVRQGWALEKEEGAEINTEWDDGEGSVEVEGEDNVEDREEDNIEEGEEDNGEGGGDE